MSTGEATIAAVLSPLPTAEQAKRPLAVDPDHTPANPAKKKKVYPASARAKAVNANKAKCYDATSLLIKEGIMSDYADLAGLQDYIKNHPSVVELARQHERTLVYTELRIKNREGAKTMRAELEFFDLVSALLRMKNRREAVPDIIDERRDVKMERIWKFVAEVKKCIRAEEDETLPLEKCENFLAKLYCLV